MAAARVDGGIFERNDANIIPVDDGNIRSTKLVMKMGTKRAVCGFNHSLTSLAIILGFFTVSLWLSLIFVAIHGSKQEVGDVNISLNVDQLNTRQQLTYQKTLYAILSSAEKNISISSTNADLRLRTSGTPQWKAMHWMLLEDSLAINFTLKITSSTPNLDVTNLTDSEIYSVLCTQTRKSITICEKLIQRYALVLLYHSCGGDQTWNSLPPKAGWVRHASLRAQLNQDEVPFDECEWLGVECATTNAVGVQNEILGSVVQLNLSSSNGFVLSGLQFPVALTLLSNLRVLDVTKQGLKGRLPDPFFSQLSSLRKLDLKLNQLTRIFNADTGNMGKLIDLEVLSISNNKLREDLPNLSELSSLRVADFEGNRFLKGRFWDSAVPHWSKIEHIDISYTSLSGSIPDYPDGKSLRHLKTLGARQSAMTGTLPVSLSEATNLETFLLDQSGHLSIGGTFPTEYGNFRNLQIGVFDGLRGIQGTLPSEYGNWGELKYLSFYETTGLTGTIPTEWGWMTNLHTLRIGINKIHGTIPTELGNCSLLRWLFIVDNKIKGTMPSEICALRKTGFLAELETNCASDGLFDGPVVCPEPDCCTTCHVTV